MMYRPNILQLFGTSSALAAAASTALQLYHNDAIFISAQPTVDICQTDDDCLNGGFCHVHESALGIDPNHPAYAESLICYCKTGYWGDQCEDRCPLLCQNGGQCNLASGDDHGGGLDSLASQYKCDCPRGYEGRLCQVRVMTQAEKEAAALSSSSKGEKKSPGAIALIVLVSLAALFVVVLVGSCVGKKRIPRDMEKEASTSSHDPDLELEVGDTEVEHKGTMT